MMPYIKKCAMDLSIGVVQTGYANDASRDYINKNLGVKPIITSTGVKYLHVEAKKYDISVYYEANGHGTILIGESAMKKLKEKLNGIKDENNEQKRAIEVLMLMYEISNQAIGV